MSIIIDERKRILIQGITGREGKTRTRLMVEYGTKVMAGCTPGKGGMEVENIPVFDTVREAIDKVGKIDISVIFVPAPHVKLAALEAIDSGIKQLVIVPDRVPIYDVLEIAHEAKKRGCDFLGPNTLGVLSIDKGVLGMIGGRAGNIQKWFKKGRVGISSRSGGMTSSIGYYLSQAGVGLSTIVHVGGDTVVGMPHPRIMALFQDDPETDIVVMFGEIGTSQEETVADMIEKGQFTKPLVAFIGGKAAKEGTRFSHAGAIIEGNRGSHEGKVSRLKEVGAHVVEAVEAIPEVTSKLLKK